MNSNLSLLSGKVGCIFFFSFRIFLTINTLAKICFWASYLYFTLRKLRLRMKATESKKEKNDGKFLIIFQTYNGVCVYT